MTLVDAAISSECVIVLIVVLLRDGRSLYHIRIEFGGWRSTHRSTLAIRLVLFGMSVEGVLGWQL